MLHMFALRFMMSENNIIPDSIADVEASCRNYIDDILHKGELPPRPISDHWPEDLRYASSHGHGYWVTDVYRDNFANIYQHLNDSRNTALDNQSTDIANEILSALRTDVDAFTKLISYRSGVGKYATFPIMHTIDVESLIDTWLSTPKANWQNIRYAFNSRFEGGRLQDDEHRKGELAMEKNWAIQLRKSLEERALALGGYKGLRISRIIPNLPRPLQG